MPPTMMKDTVNNIRNLMTQPIDPTFFDDQHSSLTELRQHFHRHPELGFKEHATSARVCDELERLDIPFDHGLGGTGVVATIKGLGPDNGRRIGLRADMDALPIQEASEHDHVSEVPGVMHACGHDGHTTMLIGAARYLARHREFSGTIYLVFQPAEEGLGGGRAMVEEGLFEHFPMGGDLRSAQLAGAAPGSGSDSTGPDHGRHRSPGYLHPRQGRPRPG